MKYIKQIILIGILFFSVATNALTIDTSFACDKGSGPYFLSKQFIVASSVKIAYSDSTFGIIPPFTFVDKLNSVIFSNALNPKATIQVQYSTSFYGLNKIYSLYKKSTLDTSSIKSAFDSSAIFGGSS